MIKADDLLKKELDPNIYIYIYIYIHIGRVFSNGPGDLCSIPGCVIPKTLETVLDTS